MGSCNTVNEKENKIIRANIHQEQGVEGDYIVPEKLWGQKLKIKKKLVKMK